MIWTKEKLGKKSYRAVTMVTLNKSLIWIIYNFKLLHVVFYN